MTINTKIVARLGKDGTEVLCGRRNCGKKLAGAIVNKGGAVHALRMNGLPPRQIDHLIPFDTTYVPPGLPVSIERCNIVFAPGWWWDEIDRVWGLTRHARRNYDADRALASGNPLTDPHLSGQARQRLEAGKSVAFKRRSFENQAPTRTGEMRQPDHRATLPAYARCPDCHAINLLPESLIDDAIGIARRRAVLDSAVTETDTPIN